MIPWSPRGSSVHGISQARVLEWVAISFSTIGIDRSIITLNVNGLNAPAKRYRLKVKGWEKIFHMNGNQKKSRVAIVISDKIDFKIKNIMR